MSGVLEIKKQNLLVDFKWEERTYMNNEYCGYDLRLCKTKLTNDFIIQKHDW
jgi:hypothetical protein